MTKVKKTLKNKSYKLINRVGLTVTMNVGRNGALLVHDEKTGFNRAIRHCPNEKSIFIDEQSTHALVEPIVFENGVLNVSSTNMITQQFMDVNPHNKVNGGSWFEEIDEEAIAQEEIEIEELIIDLKSEVRKKSKEKDGVIALEVLAAVTDGSLAKVSKMNVEQLKRFIYNKIDSNPYYFTDENGNMNIFNDDYTQRKYLVLRSLTDGVIRKSPNNKSIIWGDNKEKIVTVPVGKELVDYFTEYLSSDEGMLVLEELGKRS